MTDDLHTLLLATHRGHEPSAQRLWALLAPRLLAYAAAVLPAAQRHAAEDVVQQVFCTILTRPRRELKGIEDVTAWMFRITRNTAHNHTRSEGREQRRRTADPADPTPHAEPGHDPDRLRTATAGLPPEQLDVLLVRLVGGLTLDQAASALGVNRNTLASRHRAALDALRAALTPSPTGEPEAEYA